LSGNGQTKEEKKKRWNPLGGQIVNADKVTFSRDGLQSGNNEKAQPKRAANPCSKSRNGKEKKKRGGKGESFIVKNKNEWFVHSESL